MFGMHDSYDLRYMYDTHKYTITDKLSQIIQPRNKTYYRNMLYVNLIRLKKTGLWLLLMNKIIFNFRKIYNLLKRRNFKRVNFQKCI